jgi:hypothetical protein
MPHIRSLRKRLRAGYRGALERNSINAEANARAFYEKKLSEEKSRMASEVAELTRRTEAAEATAREVLRVRLEYGPRAYSSRFTLYATCEDRWIRNARDLSQHIDLILVRLAHMLIHEFKQIDFSRVKPNRFEPDEHHVNRYPVFFVEPGGNDRTA